MERDKLQTESEERKPEPVCLPERETPQSAFRKTAAFFFRVLVSLLLIFVIARVVDWGEFARSFSALNPLYVGCFILLFFADRLLMAFKWRVLLKSADLNAPFGLILKLYLASTVAGIFLPSTVGPDLFRVWYLGRAGLDRKKVFSSIVVERMVAFAAILILCTVSIGLVLSGRLRGRLAPEGGAIAILFGVAALAFSILILRPEIIRFLERFRKFKTFRWILEILKEVSSYRGRRRALFYFFVLTFLEQLVPTLSVFFLLLSLSFKFAVLDLLAIVPLVTFSMRLPISIDGLGVKEGLFVFLLGALEVSPAKALLVSTIDRILPILCCLPFAIPMLWRMPRKLEIGL